MPTYEKDHKDNKRTYQKPNIEQVQLLADEAVLTACKNPTTTGKNEFGCKPGTGKCKFSWTGS